MSYDNQNIFAKILRGELPCKKVYEDNNILAFHDIAPQAKTHIVIIPKSAKENLAACNADDEKMLGQLLLVAVNLAAQENLTSYRTLINCGAGAGQTVFHLHVHLLSGDNLREKLV